MGNFDIIQIIEAARIAAECLGFLIAVLSIVAALTPGKKDDQVLKVMERVKQILDRLSLIPVGTGTNAAKAIIRRINGKDK